MFFQGLEFTRGYRLNVFLNMTAHMEWSHRSHQGKIAVARLHKDYVKHVKVSLSGTVFGGRCG